ncbi:MAG: hypothetical protein RI949_2061 [Pseudomonadota bacterium]|jgi:uncharacterized protein|nr:DUF1993 domain-containing protein [Betaproteobacteria bacterium]
MTISMYSASVPVFTRLLGNALVWLDKAEAHAKARNFDPNNYLGLRLAPDMLPLTRQVQIASDAAKGAMARLAGQEVPKWEDQEASLEDLRARIRKTMDYVASFTPAQIDGSEKKAISVPRRVGDPLQFEGEAFLKHYAMANFYFHLTTLYALLRQAGVDIGKGDFLGR